MISCSKITNTYYHNGKEITKAEYDEILTILRNIPTAPEGFGYRLTPELEWELYELPILEEQEGGVV